MKYGVSTKFVFSGTFTVEADSPEQARAMVEEGCGLNMGEIHTFYNEKTCDWDFAMSPDKITGKIREVA